MAGKYFEELEVGMRFVHQPGRTVTETDNLLFTTMTLNPQPLHLDAEFASQVQHHGRLVGAADLVIRLPVSDQDHMDPSRRRPGAQR